jgi:F420H(2)-dependent quinone reductase
MPPNGEYEPSPIDRVREQVELYEAANGVEGGTLNGRPVIVLTCKGAKSGKLRKMPLMRIDLYYWPTPNGSSSRYDPVRTPWRVKRRSFTACSSILSNQDHLK